MLPLHIISSVNLANKIQIFSRQFSLKGSRYASSKYFSKEGAVFKKLLVSSNKKRKVHFEQGIPVGKLNLGVHKGNKENSRRVDVLNKIFMRHISDMLATSHYGIDLMDKGLEISKVAVSPNFQQVNVFWNVSQEAKAIELETSLPDVGFTLRHELTQLGVIGIVPRVVFIRDRTLAQAAKVDYLLSIAEYGEGHVPLTLGSAFTNNTSATPTVEPQLTEETKPNEDDSLPSEEIMPEMRQDIFGLDHSKMLSKIMKSMKKSRALHRFHPNLVIESEGTTERSQPKINEDTMTKQQRKEAMAKFIQTRKILEAKKRMNKYNDHLRMPELENTQLDDYEDNHFEEEDYLEEDEHLDKQKNS